MLQILSTKNAANIDCIWGDQNFVYVIQWIQCKLVFILTIQL